MQKYSIYFYRQNKIDIFLLLYNFGNNANLYPKSRLHLNRESSLKEGYSQTSIFERRNGVTTL